MRIELDDLTRPEVRALLAEHLENMHAISPPESVHALPVEALRAPGVSFWSVWEEGELLGCGALKHLSDTHAEVKSMRTAMAHRRRGVGRLVLAHLLEEARRRGYRRVSLETGSMDAFEPARQLYASFGFSFCGPFDEYIEDPNSVFMTLELDEDVPVCPASSRW